MKLILFFTVLTIVCLSGKSIFPQQSNINRTDNIKMYEGETKSLLEFQNSFKHVYSPPSSLEDKTVYKILAGVSFGGFLASVLFLNKDIFDAVPLLLLAAGIVFIYLGF